MFPPSKICLLMLSVQESNLQISTINKSSFFFFLSFCFFHVQIWVCNVNKQNLGILNPTLFLLGFPPFSSICTVSRFHCFVCSARNILEFSICIPCHYLLPKGLNLTPQRLELFVHLPVSFLLGSRDCLLNYTCSVHCLVPIGGSF